MQARGFEVCLHVVSLGRGGSDLSAVLGAEEHDAIRCELVKDVSGYFTTGSNVNPRAGANEQRHLWQAWKRVR